MQFTMLATAAFAAVAQAGHATWFTPNGDVAACEFPVQNDQWAVALPPGSWDNGAHCGKGIKVTHNGKTLDGFVADFCAESCDDSQIDLAIGFFQQFANTDEGDIQVDWFLH